MNEQNEIVRSDLNDLLVELESRTKAVNDTLAANLSDSAYLQALRGVQNTATRLVEINRADSSEPRRPGMATTSAAAYLQP